MSTVWLVLNNTSLSTISPHLSLDGFWDVQHAYISVLFNQFWYQWPGIVQIQPVCRTMPILGTSNVLLLCALASVNWRISGAQSLKVMTKCIDSFMWSTCLNAQVYCFLDVCINRLRYCSTLHVYISFEPNQTRTMSILVDLSLQHCTESYIQLQATLIHSTTYVVLTLDFPQLNITKVLRMCA